MLKSISVKVLKNLHKDYRVEFRNRSSLNISVSFAIVSTLSISIASGGISISDKMQAIILWIILFFSAMNTLSHVFIREEDRGTTLFLRLNARAEVVLTSKLIFNISMFFLLEAIIIPLFIFFLQVKIKAYIPFILTMIAGGLAISSSTTILAAIASKAKGKGPLFTVISFPITLPVIWVASESTVMALSRTGFKEINNIIFLFSFSAVIVILSYLLFDFIWLEE